VGRARTGYDVAVTLLDAVLEADHGLPPRQVRRDADVRLLVADGGNSKTDLALLSGDGTVLATVRGPGSNPDILGVDGCLAVLGDLVEQGVRAAGINGRPGTVADLGAFYLAGVDLPTEERHLQAAGRGPATSLERLVPAFFGLRRPGQVTEAIHFGRRSAGELTGLVPVVFAAARDGDKVAGGIVDRLADELVAMTLAVVRRLRLVRSEVDVVLGGGVLQSGEPRLLDRVHAGILAAAPRARVVPLRRPPLAGAALLALEAAGAHPAAAAAASQALTHGGRVPS